MTGSWCSLRKGVNRCLPVTGSTKEVRLMMMINDVGTCGQGTHEELFTGSMATFIILYFFYSFQ